MPERPSGVIVLLVTARTSGVGRRMESVLARLQVRDRAHVQIAKLDVEDRPDLVDRLGVQEIPSILMFRDRKRFACLRGRATLGDVERALAGHAQLHGDRARVG